jgi:hypothetical protein
MLVSIDIIFYGSQIRIPYIMIVEASVAEPELDPEPEEQQLFAGAGSGGAATFCWSRIRRSSNFLLEQEPVFFTWLRSRVCKYL